MQATAKLLTIAAFTGVMTLTAAGCSVARDQQTVGAYIDDAAISTAIRARFMEDRLVSATAIKVETLNGEVQLTGFAKTQAEKDRAEELARMTSGVKSVRNSIVVRP